VLDLSIAAANRITNISLNGNPISVPIHGADVVTRLKDDAG
jgi:hypothetical protein